MNHPENTQGTQDTDSCTCPEIRRASRMLLPIRKLLSLPGVPENSSLPAGETS